MAHNGKFYVARIPVTSPHTVDFIYEKFTDMPGGHADLVFQMDPKQPVELIYEIQDTRTKKGYRYVKVKNPITLTELVYTAEAVRVVGDTSKLVEGGLTEKFAVAYRLTSVPQRLIEPVVSEKRKTTAYGVPFDTATTQRSFWNSVNTYHLLGMSDTYHLIKNSCITSAVTALSLGLEPSQRSVISQRLNTEVERIQRLGTENLTDAQVKQILNGYINMIQDSSIKIEVSSIYQKPYFTNWLTDEQRLLLCPTLF